MQARSPTVPDAQGATGLVVAGGRIRFGRVGFAHAGQTGRLFDALDLDIRAGERVALGAKRGACMQLFRPGNPG